MSEVASVQEEYVAELRAKIQQLRNAGDRLAEAAAQYLDTGRGDLDGAYVAWLAVRAACGTPSEDTE